MFASSKATEEKEEAGGDHMIIILVLVSTASDMYLNICKESYRQIQIVDM